MLSVIKKALKITDLKKIIFRVTASILTALVVFCTAMFAIPLESEKVCDVFKDTVRLRVIANSDSEEDAKLKYLVRNDIIGVATEIFAGCTNVDEAKKRVNENMDILEKAATNSVRSHGYSIPVSITFGTEKAPVKRYSEFVFPAGEYMTLKVNLGKAKGENWWCVMYPPLCVSASTNDVSLDRQTFLNYGFSASEIDSLLNKEQSFEVRFAFLDFFKDLF